MPRGYRGPRRRKGSREFRPPRAPEKKWEPRLNAHAQAFGEIAPRIPEYQRQTILIDLAKLMRTPGAEDFLHKQKSRAAGVFVRDVARLFPKNMKLAEEYLFLLRQFFN